MRNLIQVLLPKRLQFAIPDDLNILPVALSASVCAYPTPEAGILHLPWNSLYPVWKLSHVNELCVHDALLYLGWLWCVPSQEGPQHPDDDSLTQQSGGASLPWFRPEGGHLGRPSVFYPMVFQGFGAPIPQALTSLAFVFFGSTLM